jgi:hypothetical protein
MERTVDERREILRLFLLEKRGETLPDGSKFNVQRWAKASGVSANSIYNFLNGHSEALDLLTYAKLARTADVPVARLSGDSLDPPSPTVIWVAGQVEAGVYQEATEWDRSKWYPVDIPVPSRFRGKAKALEIRGPSMNRRYPPGSIVVWVDMLAFRPPRENDRVIVYATTRDGKIEATVKELRNGWLWPDSDHPEHQTPIDPRNPPEQIESVEIKGIVIGGYRAEVF